ncbi:MAG: RNA polymerase sigma factor [Tenacibaculum sp.]
MHSQKEEIELLKKQISNAIPGALSRLYFLINSKLIAYLIQLSCGDKHKIAKDIIQELFLWIAKNHKKLENIKNLETYLYSAAKNNYLKELKKINLVSLEYNVDGHKFFKNNTNIENSHEKKIIQLDCKNEKDLWLNKALQSLPEVQQEVLYLRYYTGLDYNQISEILKVSKQICRNYVFRALRSLRKAKNYCPK